MRRSPRPPGRPSGTFRLESRFSATAGREDTVTDPTRNCNLCGVSILWLSTTYITNVRMR